MQENRPEGGDTRKRTREHPGRKAPRPPATADALAYIPRERRERVAQRRPARVISILEWRKNRATQEAAVAARSRFYQEGVRRMSTEQKQAVLIRVIMSEDITQAELDLLLLALASSA